MTDDSIAFARRRLGEVIAGARLGRRMEQGRLAARIGVSAEHIARIESGLEPLEVVEFNALAAALSLDPVELFVEVACNLPQPRLWPSETGFFARVRRMISDSLLTPPSDGEIADPQRDWG